MEKKVGDISVPIERKAERKVNGIEREIMMEEALQAADDDVEDAELTKEETTSRQLLIISLRLVIFFAALLTRMNLRVM